MLFESTWLIPTRTRNGSRNVSMRRFGFDGAPIAQFFVLCMSEAKDDLSQWRAYGGGENGVSLELCAPLLQPVTQNGAALRPVVYVEDAQHGLAADIAKWTIDF